MRVDKDTSGQVGKYALFPLFPCFPVSLFLCFPVSLFPYSIAPNTNASSAMRITTPLNASCQ